MVQRVEKWLGAIGRRRREQHVARNQGWWLDNSSLKACEAGSNSGVRAIDWVKGGAAKSAGSVGRTPSHRHIVAHCDFVVHQRPGLVVGANVHDTIATWAVTRPAPSIAVIHAICPGLRRSDGPFDSRYSTRWPVQA